MKKKFLFSALCSALIMALSACSNDDPTGGNNGGGNGGGEKPTQPGSHGVFVVNTGAQYANLPGTLGYLDYEADLMSADVFYDANRMYVGDTFNDGCVYGNQIYLAVTDSRVFHVIDRETFTLVKTVQPSAEAGPRHLTVYDGYVYCTLYGTPGYLCRINPSTFDYELLEVGPQPEYVVPFNGKLYVAVSDGYSTTLSNSCIAVVDPTSFTVTKTITGIKNPVQLATNGSQLFVCSWGEYDENWVPVNYGIREIVNDQLVGTLHKGNYMAINGNNLYYIDAAFDTGTVGYWLLDTKTGKTTEWINPAQGVFSPNAIGVDPDNGSVFILSYKQGEYGYPSYTTNGYMNMYTPQGAFVEQYETGVGPCALFFNIYE